MSKVGKSDLQGVIVIERSRKSDIVNLHDDLNNEEEDCELWRFWVKGPVGAEHQGEWMKFEDFLNSIGQAVAAITDSTFVPRGG